jgi:hypothetical protein
MTAPARAPAIVPQLGELMGYAQQNGIDISPEAEMANQLMLPEWARMLSGSASRTGWLASSPSTIRTQAAASTTTPRRVGRVAGAHHPTWLVVGTGTAASTARTQATTTATTGIRFLINPATRADTPLSDPTVTASMVGRRIQRPSISRRSRRTATRHARRMTRSPHTTPHGRTVPAL